MIDTHAHLLYFGENAERIISNMKADGLDYIVNIGTTVDDSIKGVVLASRYEKVYTTVGIYPEYATEINESDLKKIEELSAMPKVVAIGEIGLDYHQEGFDKEAQKKIFIKQLEIAEKAGKPFCVHCRGNGAAEDVYEILSTNKHFLKNSALMHCYSEGKEWFQKFLNLGMMLSFSGNITYKKSDRSFLKDIPHDRILIETDSPYLSPEPLRGTQNEPKNVRFVLDKIAFEIGLLPNELERITTENAKRFYGIK